MLNTKMLYTFPPTSSTIRRFAIYNDIVKIITYFDVFRKVFLEIVSTQQLIWNFLGNRFVKAHVNGNAQATETELVEIGISFAVLPWLLKFREYKRRKFGVQDHNKVQESHSSSGQDFMS
jgi:hypothetical protein